MTQDQEKNQTGRRALFTGAGVSKPKEECIPITEIAETIEKISVIEDSSPIHIPSVFDPVVSRLISLVQTIHQQKTEKSELEARLLKNSEQLSDLQTDNIRLSSERESYLNDLITSHTEFDRALEIFQYHDVPMVLTGPDRTLYDANDAFCTLFSIARSNITTAHPPLNTYFPDDLSITGPDEEIYSIVTLTPPVVPFDHEAISLVLLVKVIDQPETENIVTIQPQETEDNQSVIVRPDPINQAFDQFPIPAAIFNQFRTIIACNQAFCSLVARTRDTVHLRDIGSCGIRNEDTVCIAEVLQDATQRQCEAIVIHPDGSDKEVYFEIIPINMPGDDLFVLMVGVPISQEPEPIQQMGKPSDDIMFRMLLDLNPSAAALLDEHARVISANEGFSELTGLSPPDLSGTDVRDLGVKIPDTALIQDATEVQFLPDIIRMETTWGMQESSGMVVPVGTSGSGVTAILILQPISAPAEHIPESVPVLSSCENIPPKPTELSETSQLVPGLSISSPIQITTDLSAIPIPGLETDQKGKVLRVNGAFSQLTGTGPEQFEGRLREELLIPEPSGLFHLSLPAGEFWLREYYRTDSGADNLQTFWYLDISEEIRKRSSLEERIKALEIELRAVGKEKSSISASHQFNSSEQIDIVEFELNEERYAIDISMVREVVEMQPITPLPRTSPYVIGIINLRGEVTHVIDLAILLGQRPRKDRSGQKIIIIPSDVTHGEHVAIIVDNVQSVTEIMGRHVSHLGDDITTQIKTHIKGIIKISHDDMLEKHTETTQETTLIIWLDIQKILHDIQGAS